MPREIGIERTKLPSRTKAYRDRGFTLTSTARKAIRATERTGIVGLVNPCAGSRSTGNGSALSKVCLADQGDNAAAMERSFEQALIEVWRQALGESVKTVELGIKQTPAGYSSA
jgi:hypothetical protein